MAAGQTNDQTKQEPNVVEPAASGPKEILTAEAAEMLDKLVALDKEIDDEDIDLFLDQQDPHFKLALDTIGQDTQLVAVDVETDDQAQAYYEELERWKNSTGLFKIIFRIFPVAPRVSLAAKTLFYKAKRSFIANWIRFKNWTNDFVRTSLKNLSIGFKNKKEAWMTGSKKWLREYKFMSWRIKIQLYLTILLGAGGMAGLYFVYQGKILPPDTDLFIATMEDVATGTYHYDPSEATELFYNNIRSVPNLFLIPKIVTNIKASSQSGETPMLAVEFFAEGFTPEVIIEMKDREPALRDLAQRTLEDFSFDELETSAGKQKMTLVLMRELNRILTTGQIKAIRIKTLILKP